MARNKWLRPLSRERIISDGESALNPPGINPTTTLRLIKQLGLARGDKHSHWISRIGVRRAAGSVSWTQNVIGWLCSRPRMVYHSTFQMNIQKTDNNTADIRTLPMVSATSRCYFTMLELTGSRTAEYHIFQPDITLSCDISLTCSSTKENSICILYIECIFLALSFLELLSFTVEKRGPHTTARQYQLLLWFSN